MAAIQEKAEKTLEFSPVQYLYKLVLDDQIIFVGASVWNCGFCIKTLSEKGRWTGFDKKHFSVVESWVPQKGLSVMLPLRCFPSPLGRHRGMSALVEVWYFRSHFFRSKNKEQFNCYNEGSLLPFGLREKQSAVT